MVLNESASWRTSGGPSSFAARLARSPAATRSVVRCSRRIGPAMVAAIQIDDGPTKPVLDDYIQDCLHYRQPLGEGQFPLKDFLSLLPLDAPLSVEVISDEMDLLPIAVVADRLYRSLVATVPG